MKKILIVEDEQSIQTLYLRILKAGGYATVFAGGVEEAVEKIREHDDFDLLVTDMKLPDGDGLEVIRRFQGKYPRTKVLIITGSPSPEPNVRQLRGMGFSGKDILFKPFEIKEFESAVRACLEEP